MANHFILNQSELDRLATALKLKNPINVQGSATRGNTNGRYHGLSRYTVKGKLMPVAHHQITLACDTPVERLVETLIHECVHALQQERTQRGGAVYKRYSVKAEKMRKEVVVTKGRLSAWDKYWTDPIEVEARGIAEKLAPSFPALLAPRPLKQYVVTQKYGSDRVWLVTGARSPQSAAARISSNVYGSSAYASHFSARVLKPSDDPTAMRPIRWTPR